MLINFYNYCIINALPFAFYRLPGTETPKVLAQKNSRTRANGKAGQAGFIFAPFVEDKVFKRVFIKGDVVADAHKLPKLDFADLKGGGHMNQANFNYSAATKKGYKEYVKKIKRKIRKGQFNKVVAARVALRKKSETFNPVVFFERLCKTYPAAFVSMVYTPKYGIWIGATPEILLKTNKSEFITYALAGTKTNNSSEAKNWGLKEKEEQNWVSKFIIKQFSKVTASKPQVTGPSTIAAGNLLHLRTKFKYKNIPVSLGHKVVGLLHPTPAIAGLPAKKAIRFIGKEEPSYRAFYSGYLGPVSSSGNLDLFVNLRCLHVLQSHLAIFAGCGITGDSNPDKEWQESENKTRTLLNVLETDAKKRRH